MAKSQRTMKGNFDKLLKKIEDGILNGSLSASLEGRSDFRGDSSRCSVLVFERYSYVGGNRLSLTVTLFQEDHKDINVSCIAAGGSQAMLFKVNKFGESAFLNKVDSLLDEIENK